MKNFFILFLIAFSVQTGSCQTTGQLWKGYFSYNSIKDVSNSLNRFYAASENALFSKSTVTNEIKTINTIDGLPSQTISALYHSNSFNKTLIGYDNGLMIVINDVDGSILNVVDIINKQIPPNIKKINHFMEHDGIVYISCDFGIVQYNLATLQFGDTYFIGLNTPEIKVNQTAFYNGFIYAATLSEGLKKADITNPNLIDANQWQTTATGSWTGIASFGTDILGVRSDDSTLRKSTGGGFSFFSQLDQPSVDLRANDGYLIATTPDRVYLYNQQYNPIQINSNAITDLTAVFTCATLINTTIYMGTRENGVITSSISNPSNFQLLSPAGPLRNNIFAINATAANLWAVFGDYDVDYNPYPLDYFGISKFTSAGWLNIPYSDIKTAVGKDVASMVRITVNPSNEKEVYISSFHSGLLKLENDVPTILYNETNSGLEAPPGDTSVRIDGTAFDKSGNLWVTNSIVKNGIKVLKTSGDWQKFSLEGFYSNVGKLNIGRLTIDKNNTKWMVTRDDGIIAFNENGNVIKKITDGAETGNLPSPTVKVATIDNHNQLWIGTTKGLRVLPSVDSFLSDDTLKTNAIIILEDGIGQELLFSQYITDIVVDGSNNKWIGTADAGVFHVSSDGQEVLHRFTSSNSPLPSNSINDIDINPTTGEVFFATDKGMVSYKGTAVEASGDLKNVLVYPNPVRPEFTGTVKITGLLDKANIKITDIEGNLVYEVISEGGSIEWDTKAFGKYKVASGVYMIFISSQDGLETKVKKVMIIR